VALVSASAFAGIAQAADPVDRVQVGGVSTQPVTRGFSPALSVALRAPSPYQRGAGGFSGTIGNWAGPAFRAANDPEFTGPTRLGWGVTFTRGTSLQKLAKAESTLYPQVLARKLKVRHLVDKKAVGRIPARFVVDAERTPGARVDGVLAIGLSKRVVAIVGISAFDPPITDGGSKGAITVAGKTAAAWNLDHVKAAIAKVHINGNLPPRRVSARAAGRKVAGKVLDAFGHPSVRAIVELKAGKRVVAKGTTSSRGTFSLTAPSRGSHRVTANVEGFSASSKVVKAR
jgi:hypothetical protein